MAPASFNADPDVVISQLQSLAKDAPKDATTRKKLYDAARSLTFALEPSGDTIYRFLFASLQANMACIADDIGLFKFLTESSKPVTLTELTEEMKIDPELLERIVRYLSSMDMVSEVDKGVFTASNCTKTLSRTPVMATVRLGVNFFCPCFQQLPKFLSDTKYRNPSDSAHSPFQLGHKTDLPTFAWLMSQESHLANFNHFMTVQHEGDKVWLDEYPFEKELCENVNPEIPLFVDIGGGIGQQCSLLKSRYPRLPGRVILQDTAQVIQQAPPVEGVERMSHNFWLPQPVKDARAYYMRNIMHDYTDEKCIEILRNIMPAMGSDSVILIDEIVMPDKSAHWHATALDICVMTMLASRERTLKQWQTLLDSAGMEITGIYTHTAHLQDSIIVAVPKDHSHLGSTGR